MVNVDKQRLHKALSQVKEKREFPGEGICPNVNHYLLQDYRIIEAAASFEILKELMKEWPDAGFNIYYPIDGFVEYVRAGDLWENPRRLALLDYLIEQTKENES